MDSALWNLSVRDLCAVLTLARERHFGRAAKLCHVTQPTLSSQVKKVESLLGVTLFERGNRRFIVTSAGKRILPKIQEIVDRVEMLGVAAAAAKGAPLNGEFHLGAITTLGPFYIPRFLPGLIRSYPSLILQLTERLTDELLEQVKSGQLDAALISGVPGVSGLEYIPLFDEPFLLLAPASHRIVKENNLSMDKLQVDEMVLMDEGHCLRDQALDLCNGPKLGRPSIVATSFETLRHLVASGWGYTLFPCLAIRDDPSLDPMLAYLDFGDGSPSREIGLAYRTGSAREADTLALASYLEAHPPEGVRLHSTRKFV